MRITVISRILGILLMLFSITMLFPILVSIIYQDGTESAFFIAFAITVATGLLCWLPASKPQQELRTRDGFLVTVLFWTVLGLFGAFPFMFALPQIGLCQVTRAD